jgi:probable HAF family extracellular repeat protein
MNMRTRLSRSAGVIFLAASTFCAAQTYTVTDLGTISGDDYSVGRGINSSGQVAGAVGNSSVSDVAFYGDGTWTNLGTLGGNSGIGNAVNTSGQVAGYSTSSDNGYHAFITVNGSLVNIGDLGGGSAVAYGLNESGEVVGSSVTADGNNHPFLYSNGTMTDLGTLNSPAGNLFWNTAQGINRSGEVVGTSYDAKGNFLAFVWSNGKMRALGTLGGLWSQGFAINNKGQTTGIAYLANGEAHAFLETNGKMTDLGTLEGAAFATWGFAINDSGVVAGQADVPSGYHAFVCSAGKMKDLNKLIPAGSGWLLEIAYGINNAGQIVGLGVHNGQEHGFLLTPQ